LSSEQVSQLLRELRHTDKPDRRKNRREHERLPFNEDALLLCEVKSGEKTPPYLVKCIDLSVGGLGFLHGAYVHVGTPCIITLIVGKKQGFRADAKVARCEHHKGHVHVVGVKFDQPLSAEQVAALKAIG
jgi:hypothetical protein